MLAIAERKFPNLPFHRDNLIDFDVKADFDVMICLYGSIGFVKTVANLRAALKRVAAQLRPDGVALITPWSTKEEFQECLVVDAVDEPNLKISRMEQVRLKEPDIVEVIFHHLIGKGTDVTYHQQSVEIGLFSRQDYISAMTDAGLTIVEEYTGSDVRGGAYLGKRIIP